MIQIREMVGLSILHCTNARIFCSFCVFHKPANAVRALDDLLNSCLSLLGKKKKKNLRLKTNNKSTGEAQPANYLKSRTDYTAECQLVNAN
jgi:hypothetical protein